MKKVLTGALLMGTVAMASYAEESERVFSPRGTVEIGFENERVNSAYENASFVLPYVKTKTFFNETTPYYMEANYSFRYHTEKDDSQKGDKRQRYELYFGGYQLINGNFAFTPKIGFRHEDFSNRENGTANRTVWRVYPNMSYKVNDEHAIFLGGFVAYIDAQQTGDTRAGDMGSENNKDYSDYLHELELGHKYKLNSRQIFQTSLYSEYEKNVYDGTSEIWELRFRFNHAMENGKTDLSFFTRLPINRERRGYVSKYNANGDIASDAGSRASATDNDRTRIGVSGSHKVDDSWTVLGEVWYQTQTKKNGPSQDTIFTKLAMRYSY